MATPSFLFNNLRLGYKYRIGGCLDSFYYFDPAKSSSMTLDAPFTGELTLLFSTFNGVTGLPVEFADAVVTNAPAGAKTDSKLYDGTGQQVSRTVSALNDVIGPTFDGVLWAYALDGVWYYINQGNSDFRSIFRFETPAGFTAMPLDIEQPVSLVAGDTVSMMYRTDTALGTGYFTEAKTGTRAWSRLFTGGVVYYNDAVMQMWIDNQPCTSLQTKYPSDNKWHFVELRITAPCFVDRFAARNNDNNQLAGWIADIKITRGSQLLHHWPINDNSDAIKDVVAGNDGLITNYLNRWSVDVKPDPIVRPIIALMGTSFVSQQTQLSAVSLNYSDQGSMSYFMDRRGWPFQFEPSNNFASFGSTIREVIDNQLANMLAQHAATPFKYVFMNIGGNDSRGGRTLSEMQADAQELYDALTAVGITPVVEGLSPRYELLSDYGANELETNKAFNAWNAAHPDVIAIDIFDAMTNGLAGDAGWNTLSKKVYDSNTSFLHPSANAAYQMGKEWNDQFPATRYGYEPIKDNANLWSATNPSGSVFDNPALSGGTTAPTGMSTGGGVWSSLGNSVWECDLAPSVVNFFADSIVNTGGWVAGSALVEGAVIYAVAEIEIENVVDINDLFLRVNVSDGTTTVQTMDHKANSANDPAGSISIDAETGKTRLMLRTPKYTIPAYSGSGNTLVLMRVDAVTGATGSGKMRVLSFNLRRDY